MLLATPTFLQIYLAPCTPAQFGSVRLVLAGAEKLPERLADAFEERFGIRPLEGYGTTECAPAIAVSAPDFRAPGFYQAGSRRVRWGSRCPACRCASSIPTRTRRCRRTRRASSWCAART
jgi:acyl-[acyl-carrier-protein]-phospholipid O-acyltransferase/long-chain-fatty-acid--[acyl-carrier-protein] ligase